MLTLPRQQDCQTLHHNISTIFLRVLDQKQFEAIRFHRLPSYFKSPVFHFCSVEARVGRYYKLFEMLRGSESVHISTSFLHLVALSMMI